MAERQTFRYGSKASNFNAILQGPEPIYLPNTATQVGVKKTIVAEFGECEPEFPVMDVNGDPLLDTGMNGQAFGRTANIRGHFFDSRVQQESKGWTDEEHDRVVARLDYLCQRYPFLVWKLEEVRHGIPWPTYDTVHHNTVVELAKQLGLVGEALNYERQNKNRPTVVAGLEKVIAAEEAERQAEDALVA